MSKTQIYVWPTTNFTFVLHLYELYNGVNRLYHALFWKTGRRSTANISCGSILHCFQVLQKMINNGHFNSHISLLHLKSAKHNKYQILGFVLVTFAFSMCVKWQQAKVHLISKCVEGNNQGNIHSWVSLLWKYEMTESFLNKSTY